MMEIPLQMTTVTSVMDMTPTLILTTLQMTLMWMTSTLTAMSHQTLRKSWKTLLQMPQNFNQLIMPQLS